MSLTRHYYECWLHLYGDMITPSRINARVFFWLFILILMGRFTQLLIELAVPCSYRNYYFLFYFANIRFCWFVFSRSCDVFWCYRWELLFSPFYQRVIFIGFFFLEFYQWWCWYYFIFLISCRCYFSIEINVFVLTYTWDIFFRP